MSEGLDLTFCARRQLSCIEAGIYPNNHVRESFKQAQKLLSPDVRFIWLDGNIKEKYDLGWKAADVFVSLSDNIQETFGITPLEAMASGLPVIVSDWDGYKDTVPNGEIGFRINSIMSSAGTGNELALKYSLGVDNYDTYIGKISLATAIDHQKLTEVLEIITTNKTLRIQMGIKAKKYVKDNYDNEVIIEKYLQLSRFLNSLRKNRKAKKIISNRYPNRIDPFERYQNFKTENFDHEKIIQMGKNDIDIEKFIQLEIISYELKNNSNKEKIILNIINEIKKHQNIKVKDLLKLTNNENHLGINCVMWLYKFNYIENITN